LYGASVQIVSSPGLSNPMGFAVGLADPQATTALAVATIAAAVNRRGGGRYANEE
jgi:hypothetical protein